LSMKTILLLALVASAVAVSNVRVDFVSESYCPGCESYSTTQLANAIGTVGNIMDVFNWPYGNAQESKNADGTWKYTCQHGNNECIGNMYEACAIEHNNHSLGDAMNTPAWWAFFDCMELSGNAGVASVASNCATKGGLDWATIQTCAGSNPAEGTSTDGNPIMHQMAVFTNNLQPPHQWTPWVIVDGTPLTSAQLDLSLIPIVCNAYTKKGGVAPSGCKSLVSAQLSMA